MADRKDKINEQQAEQEIREEIREEMKHADQEPAQEQYSLNDDRRVKVLSPGMLVAKRFFSVIRAPENRPGRLPPMMVTSGISVLRKACL